SQLHTEIQVGSHLSCNSLSYLVHNIVHNSILYNMSGSVGTARAGSNRHTGSKDKMAKTEKHTQQQQQQQTIGKSEQQSKMQPTQEQIRLAQMMSTNQKDADPSTVHELMELTGKSEEDVVIALHDAENDADRAVMILLEGGDEQQGEWREQGGKRKKKSNTSALKDSDHTGEDQFDSRPKDRGDREDSGIDRGDLPPRRGGRRNGGPPPRLARGRGRDRGNVGDRENRDRSNTEDWDNDRGDDKRDRSGADRGRPRGKGGFGVKRGGGSGRGRFSNSNDREGNSRSFNRVPRFEKMINSQHIDGPEIDTWTNETAESKTVNKDTDWDNWNDTWVSEEDQWTGTLEETKVFTPSTMKIPEAEPVIPEAPSSLGQRLDVGSLFIESAKFSKAPDYSKPSGDAYITQFNQAATESIKNTIGIGSSSRGPHAMNSLSMTQQSTSDSLGLSTLAQSTSSPGVGVLPTSPSSMTQMSQISQSVSQAMSQISGGMSSQNLSAQSRIPSVQQQQQQQSLAGGLQQRPKPQRSKLPPPSKIPASAVEMPGHLSRNTQLDLQFGIDFGSESNTTFGFDTENDSTVETSTYATTSNGTSSVISNHINQAHTVSKAGTDNTRVSGLMSSPSSGSANVPSPLELQQSNRSASVFHNSVYTSSPPKNDSQNLDRDQNKLGGSDSIAFPSSQMERKSPMMSQRVNQPSQNLSTGSMAQNKNDGSSNFSSTNGYSSNSYQSHQKSATISHNQSSFNHSSSSQPPQSSPFPGQYPASQSAFPSTGQSQFGNTPGSSQFPLPTPPPQFNNAQNQYSAGQNQYSSGSSSHTPMPHGNHQSQYSGPPNSYSSGGQTQFSGYQNSSNTSFPSHPPSGNFSSPSQSSGPSGSLYPATTQSGSGTSSYPAQSNSYQSPSAGSYNPTVAGSTNTHASTGVNFPNPPQGLSLKPSTSQTNTNYNSQSFGANATALQPSSLANKLGESLSKMTLKDTATLDAHQSSQYDHPSTSTTSASASLSLPSTTTAASLSSGTSTISSTSTAASVTSTSRIASMPSTSKAPPNLPPGVPLMGQYIMSQNTMPPFYSVPPVYGYEDMQLLQQRMPLQAGSYYDMGSFPAPPGSTLPAGRDQQPPLPNVPFSGTSADSSKVPRVDAQSPNSSNQPQNAHSAAQPLFNYHYGFYYPSMFPGTAAGLQYPMFPMPPVTNAAAHAGTTATTQFQKSYASHMYSTKGYDELNQAQDFSKTGYGSSANSGKASGTRMSTRSGTSEMTPNAYNKPHTQPFDKQGFHGGTPPPYNLPLASATQSGQMGGPTNPYGAPFLPVMAAHQAHSQMIHHPIQQ
ncbi:hypothetical protein EGW08_007232, partial [Elysia chlorotica]